MERNDSWAEISQAITRYQDFVIVGHSIPDGDCIGSIVALYLGLVAAGKDVVAVLDDEVPSIYCFLEGSRMIRKPVEVETWPKQVIYLDCSDRERVGDTLAPYLARCSFIINIDHHISNSFFGDLNRVESEAASTAELVLELLDELGVCLNPSIAAAIYTGIVMDTGGFQYGNTRPRTMRVAARLLEEGADIDNIRINLFESRERVEISLLQRALSSLDFTIDGKVAWMLLSYQDLVELEAHQYHFEGLINYARFIKGVEVGMLFREIEPGVVKIGFRSKSYVDVNQLARRFGGGGHPRAAGAQLYGDIHHIRDEVVEMVREVVNACTGS